LEKKMRKLFSLAAVASAIAVSPVSSAMAADTQPAALEPGTHADSPLKLTEIWARSQFTGLRISPDGKYFAGTAAIENNKSILHIIDRKTMTVIHSENFTGEFSVGSVEWFDNENLLVNPSVKSELAEGRGSAGSFLLNIKTKDLRPLWDGVTADYGGGEGGGILGKIDAENYWMILDPSGSTYSEFPFVYLYRLNIRTGIATKVLKSPSRGATFIFNKDNEVTHAVGMLPDSFDDTVVHKRVGDKWVLESQFRKKDGGCVPMRWHKVDPNKILYMCDIEAPTSGAYWVDAKTGKKELIYRNPKVDFDGITFNQDDEPVAVQYQYDYPVWQSLKPDAIEAKRHNLFTAAFGNKLVEIRSATDDDIERVLYVHDEHGVGKYYLYNEYDGKIRFLLDPKPAVKEANFPDMLAVNFKARDGLDIVGYLTVPKNKPMKNLPLIIHPHGGPYGPRDNWGYNPEVAAFANAGYAVLQVNYRGSGGYGRKFTYDWYGHWGLEMQEDLEDATHWAVQAGIADPKRICIYGASYGGYAALEGVVKTPDLYKCSIGYVGVYDLTTFMHYGDVSRSKGGQKYLAEALGTDQADRDRRSPTPNVNKIKVPLFLVEGMQDDRVFPKHYLDLKQALKAKGHRFETLEIQRAAHGAQDLPSVMEISCRMIDFFDREIGPKKPTDKPDNCKFPGAKDLSYEYYEGK
jgi:dipeptidyl aminopeptidase/acylaminoacyl peptidase